MKTTRTRMRKAADKLKSGRAQARIPAKLQARLEAIGEQHDVSMPNMIRLALERFAEDPFPG